MGMIERARLRELVEGKYGRDGVVLWWMKEGRRLSGGLDLGWFLWDDQKSGEGKKQIANNWR